jgi:hypothetical protein
VVVSKAFSRSSWSRTDPTGSVRITTPRIRDQDQHQPGQHRPSQDRAAVSGGARVVECKITMVEATTNDEDGAWTLSSRASTSSSAPHHATLEPLNQRHAEVDGGRTGFLRDRPGRVDAAMPIRLPLPQQLKHRD